MAVVEACSIVEDASEELRRSVEEGRLGRLLALVLRIGNSLNTRVHNKAAGFRLATLLKLGDTRTFFNPQVTPLLLELGAAHALCEAGPRVPDEGCCERCM